MTDAPRCRTCRKANPEVLWCTFCDRPICVACDYCTDFGHTCAYCYKAVRDGRIDEHGAKQQAATRPYLSSQRC